MNELAPVAQNFKPLSDLYEKMMKLSSNPNDLCLQLENDEVKVTKDDPSGISILETFFLGRKDESNFPLVLKKVSSQIEHIDPSHLNETDRNTLALLIDMVNAIGRKTFSHLTNNYVQYYLVKNSFEEYQIKTQDTLVPYAASLSKGLRNLGKNICWFNATIKYLAITQIFDDAIVEGLNNPLTHNSCQKLLHLLNALRKDYHQNIVDFLHTDFMEHLSKIDCFAQLFDRKCQDMDEFYILFFDYLGSVTKMTQMKSNILIFNKENELISSEEKKVFHLRLQVHAQPDLPIDLVNDMLHNSSNEEGQIKEVLIDIPETLNFSVCRANFTPTQGASFLYSPIAFLPNGTIELTKYEEKKNDERTRFEPSEIHVFTPTCAIIRKESKITQGHFTCLERVGQNRFFEHNDSRVNANIDSKNIEQAFFLHLKRSEIRPLTG